MHVPWRARRLGPALAATAVACLTAAAAASAHARVSPAVSLSNHLQLYSLAVPTEKAAPAATTRIVLTVPKGFSIDSFVPTPGWRRAERSTGSGDNTVFTRITWTGGHVPSGEDALFQFLAEPSGNGTYAFPVQQTYSDGSIVNWTGPESSANPAPTIAAKASLGGGDGGGTTLGIVALVVGAVGVLLGIVALASRGGRKLA